MCFLISGFVGFFLSVLLDYLVRLFVDFTKSGTLEAVQLNPAITDVKGRIRNKAGYPSRARVSRGSDRKDHQGIWAGAVNFKRSKTPKKLKGDQPTNRPTDGWTKRGVE